MPKFTVDVKEVWCRSIQVNLPVGATKEQILDAANQKIAEGDDGETEYDYTLDLDRWNVRDEQGHFI